MKGKKHLTFKKVGKGYNSKINEIKKINLFLKINFKNAYYVLYEKLTTLSILSLFLNRLVKILSKMGFWDLTDDNYLPLILYHFSTILAHTLYEYLLSNRGAPRLFTRAHLLSKASMWPRESRIRGQDGRRWRCWCGEKYKERNPQELSHLEHTGRNILSPPECRSIGMLVSFLNARSNFWGCPLTFSQMDSGYLAFPSQIHWVQPVQ